MQTVVAVLANTAHMTKSMDMFVQTAKAIMLLISLNMTIHAISGSRNGENGNEEKSISNYPLYANRVRCCWMQFN